MHFIFISQFPEFWTQGNQCDQSRNSHQAVNQFCQRPDQAGFQHGTEYDHGRLQQREKLPAGCAKQILCASDAVKPPAKNRGKGKAAYCKRQQDGCPISQYERKRLRRQFRAHTLSVRDRNAAAKDHKCRHGTDYDGVKKHFHNAHQALTGCHIHLCGGMGDGCGSHSGFVCKYTPGYPDP